MCQYKTLEKSKDGYVVRCNKCRHLHVAFGSNVLSFSEDQFFEFVNTVDGYFEDNKHSAHRDMKTIQIPTVARSIMLLYSLDELDTFSTLLHQAKKQLEQEKLTCFYEN